MIDNKAYRIAYEFHKKWEPCPATVEDLEKCTDEMGKISYENNNDPLLIDLLIAAYNDLEREWDAAEKRGEVRNYIGEGVIS